MHGLIARSLQSFILDTYGQELWEEILHAASGPAEGFEPLLVYPERLVMAVAEAACQRLARSRDSLLEDLGTYLVSHPRQERLRRLLRFGGADFADFLQSLDDLPGRARLAVSDLDLPVLDLSVCGDGRYEIQSRRAPAGFVAVLTGVLRAMADDYGALVLIEPGVRANGVDVVRVDLLDQRFAEGRQFDLALARRG